MSEKVYINDDFGNKIPLLDEFGNLSVQVIMLYTEDKLESADRKVVKDFVATDEMSKDALEGYMLTTNSSRTRHTINELNSSIQKQSGSKSASPLVPVKKDSFDYRKLAAAITLLIVAGGTIFLASKYFKSDDLAVKTKPETVTRKRNQRPQIEQTLIDIKTQIDSVKTNQIESENTEEEAALNLKHELLEQTSTKDKEKKEVEKDENQIIETVETEKSGLTQKDVNAVMPNNDADIASGILSQDSEEVEDLAEVVEASQASSTDDSYSRNKRLLLDDESGSVGLRQPISATSQPVQAKDLSSDVNSTESISESSTEARYPGGDIMMYKFLEKKKNYTEAMRAQGISGNVTITFKVEADGRVTDAKVKTGVNGLLDQDALRIVRSMPNWSPAIENGIPVSTTKSVIIKYGD